PDGLTIIFIKGPERSFLPFRKVEEIHHHLLFLHTPHAFRKPGGISNELPMRDGKGNNAEKGQCEENFFHIYRIQMASLIMLPRRAVAADGSAQWLLFRNPPHLPHHFPKRKTTQVR